MLILIHNAHLKSLCFSVYLSTAATVDRPHNCEVYRRILRCASERVFSVAIANDSSCTICSLLAEHSIQPFSCTGCYLQRKGENTPISAMNIQEIISGLHLNVRSEFLRTHFVTLSHPNPFSLSRCHRCGQCPPRLALFQVGAGSLVQQVSCFVVFSTFKVWDQRQSLI